MNPPSAYHSFFFNSLCATTAATPSQPALASIFPGRAPISLFIPTQSTYQTTSEATAKMNFILESLKLARLATISPSPNLWRHELESTTEQLEEKFDNLCLDNHQSLPQRRSADQPRGPALNLSGWRRHAISKQPGSQARSRLCDTKPEEFRGHEGRVCLLLQTQALFRQT